MTPHTLRRTVARIRGICLTHYVNACDRRKGSPRRPCLVAYVGAGRTFKSKRFMIDTLGAIEALRAARLWRALRSGVQLTERTCDRPRSFRASIPRRKK